MVITVFLIVSLSGCWDRREVEDLGVVHSIGIELGENDRVRVIFQYINTSVHSGGGGGGRSTTFEKPYRNRVIEAESLYDAIKQLPDEAVARRFFAHTELLIISKEFARERGLTGITDYLTRDPQFLPRAWLIIGCGCSLVELMDTSGVISPVPTQRIRNMLMHRKKVSNYAPLRLGEFTAAMQSDGCQPYTAVIELWPNPFVPPPSEGFGYVSGEIPEPMHTLIINGTALFREDKLIGQLDRHESRGLLWLRGEVREGQIKFPLPDDPDRSISTEIIKTKTEVKPVIRDGELLIQVKISADTVVEEVQGHFPFDRAENIKRLEKAQNQAIVRDIEAALVRAQKEFQSDAFGFGDAVHRQNPEVWQQIEAEWTDIFPSVAVELEVETIIRRTNLTSRPTNA